MAFVFYNHAIEPLDDWLPAFASTNGEFRGPPTKLVLAWGIAEEMMALVPPYAADTETDAKLQEACNTLNEIANGRTDLKEGLVSLEKNRADLKKIRHESVRRAAAWLGFLETICTAACAGISALAFYGLYSLDWAGGNVFWTDVENAIKATGYAVAGFSVAVLLRRLYFARVDPISDVAGFLEKGWAPWELAAVNFLLVILSIASIFFGVKVADSFNGFGLIASPWTALLPGVLLGLAAPRVLKGLLGR